MSFKTEISDINLNGVNYKYHHNKYDNIHYLTSTEQTQELLDFINIFISNKSIDWNVVIDEINKYKNRISNNTIVIEDKYNVFNINIKYKYKISNSLKIIQKSREKPINIPNELFLNNKQLTNMLINEINKVNTNLNYEHYIAINNNDLMDLSFRFVYKNNDITEFELNVKLSDLHPYLPPIISYIGPKIDINLILAIYNLDIWKPSNWNYLISLDWLISNLGSALEPLFFKYIDTNNTFNFIELKMLELNKYNTTTDIVIDLKFNKIINDNITNTVFKKGTGYGSHNNDKKWDINQFIDINKSQDQHTINILTEIIDYINKNNCNIPDQLNNYIINKFTNINLLIFNNQINLYKILLSYINLIKDSSILNSFVNSSRDIINEIKMIINNNIELEESFMSVYLYYIDLFDKYNIDINKEKLKLASDSQVDKYIEMVKENNFDTFELNNSHRFFPERLNNINPKTIMRIMSELSSLKKDLPVNWDSSILVRMSETKSNLISFMIVGPKDTPYHNGLFEFHAYFPDTYPSVVPKVLIKTTDNDRVRFNPNLYSNGKVCLSLLGTWTGDKGESWIPEISTFFQVLISIQSLILVDEPFYNEPGYEKSFNTVHGKKHSENYNDNIRYETVRVAMIGMLKNKVDSYETFIEEHFKLKKDEIIKVVDKWYNESLNKERFKKVYDELLSLL